MKTGRHYLQLALPLLLNFLTLAAPLSAPAQGKPYFDELYKGSELREVYKPLKEYLESPKAKADEEAFLIESRRAFQKDNALDPVPRILTADEAKQIQEGVEQRARALRAFLKDHYSGKRTYAKAGIMSEETVARIISRTGELALDGVVNPETVSFMYGPDIIRDADGKWRVIEDNHGFVGGIGDLKLAFELIMKKHPSLAQSYEFADPMVFYRSIARAYREKALAYGGKAILYMTPPYADNEDKRVEKIFAAEGVETITPDSKKELKITSDGVFLLSEENGRRSREKVGYVFMNGEHAWLDNTFPASRIRNVLDAANEYLKDKKAKVSVSKQIASLLADTDPKTRLPDISELERILKKEEALDLEKSHAAGLLKAIVKNKVGCNYSPGVDFIGDKEFYIYVEDLIRHYLKETPILKNIPSRKFVDEKTGELKTGLLRKVSREKDEFVLKKVDGRGGDSVWVGSKTSQEAFDQVLEEVAKNPFVYKVQSFKHLSVLRENIVDLRAFAAVFPDRVIVAETPWGRGLPMDGNGKVNLSDKGREVAVLVAKSLKTQVQRVRCQDIFRQAN